MTVGIYNQLYAIGPEFVIKMIKNVNFLFD
jgi:hypothetical protein